jgi:hypothetical protein
MVADRYERYAISHVPEGLQISLWQALPSLGFGVIALVILTACFLTDPYAGHVRIWAGLGVVALQGQRPLTRCASEDFQQVVFVPTTATAFHGDARAVGMLLQE